MINSRRYDVFFCLRRESYFEESHKDYSKSLRGLVISYSDLTSLLDECIDRGDLVGVSVPTGTGATYDSFQIHGVDGRTFDLKLEIATGSGFLRRAVSKAEVKEILENFDQVYSLMNTPDSIDVFV